MYSIIFSCLPKFRVCNVNFSQSAIICAGDLPNKSIDVPSISAQALLYGALTHFFPDLVHSDSCWASTGDGPFLASFLDDTMKSSFVGGDWSLFSGESPGRPDHSRRPRSTPRARTGWPATGPAPAARRTEPMSADRSWRER